MKENTIVTEKAMTHPIEEVLEIEAGTTYFPAIETTKTELVVAPEFDPMDTQINEQFQEIYDTAMDAYEQQALDIETIEPKYRARNSEVAVQYLNTALTAAKEKSTTKMFKDKLLHKARATGPKTLNQNVIVADRNDLLKELFRGDDNG